LCLPLGCLQLEIPEELQVTCESDADCPTDYLCRELPGGKECIEAGVGSDQNPPEVFESSLSPALGKKGTLFTARFSTSEALASAEVFTTLGDGTDKHPFQRVGEAECSGTGESFSCVHVFTFEATETEVAGERPVIADLLDESANRNPDAILGTLALDFADPRIEVAALEPALLTGDTPATFTLTLSEEVPTPPSVTATREDDGAEGPAFVPQEDDGGISFSYEVAEEVRIEGVFELQVRTADAAGNELAETLVQTLRIDLTPPLITGHRISGDGVAGPGDVVEVHFTLVDATDIAVFPTLQVPVDAGTPPGFGVGV